MIGPLAAYPVTQLGFVVPDLDEAMRVRWHVAAPGDPAGCVPDIVYRGGRCSTTSSRSATWSASSS